MGRMCSEFMTCVLLVLVGAPCIADDPPPRNTVALWVTRWDFRSQADVERAIDDAAWLGITDVLWQVRGQADAYYDSPLEPWGEELFSDRKAELSTLTKTGPGFDPLSVAVARAHAKGIRLHAWVNMMPLWKGTSLPAAADHPLLTHADWRLQDSEGNAQPLNEHYVIVNPLLPEVREHLTKVCVDLATRYEIDGLHMDYIRFVSDSMQDATVYPGDRRSRALFNEATGHTYDGTGDSRAAMQDFIRLSITNLVRQVRREATAARPGMAISAAVWRRPDLALNYQQDAATWLNEGLLDRAFPMIYTDKDADFLSDLAAWRAASPKALITAGIGSYKHQPAEAGSQISLAAHSGSSGAAVFAYASLFESVNPNEPKTAAAVSTRLQRRAAIRTAIASAFPPENGR